MDNRRAGLNSKLDKVRQIVLNGICSAYSEKENLEINCKIDLDSDLEIRYTQIVNLLTVGTL
jgi:hypothetical protein